ncbi:MAG: alpha-amylase family protein [Eubacteriales bacterium]|nr:alpha-amylase family protein [Eubacteriales bacterium]
MDLKQNYYHLYGTNELTEFRFRQLEEIIAKAKKERPAALKKQDAAGNDWYLSEKMAGMMLYVDRFSTDLYGFEKKIDYLAELGITYVHFMPLLKSREGNNDGGYAVSDYLEVDKKLGDMKQLEKVVGLLKKRGIRTCIDFVLNHTAKEHVWVKEMENGNHDYDNMYHMFDDDTVPKEYEKTMTEIFPEVAPKNFTYYPDLGKYVMTRFYEFQWDLNYANPQVFNKIVEVLLTLANKGIDIFRLDAIPYMWKEIGTSCMNHPNVHTLLRMMYCIVREVAPSVIFLGEAIVEPHEIVKYFGTRDDKECNVMYNASLMVLLWNSLATRDVRLMVQSLAKDYGVPPDGVWINYARCHDDIGWGFENDILRGLGLDPEAHKQFMIRFMEGRFPGSFAEGELYEFNPVTLDARNSGTFASMCGLEQALREKHQYKIEQAVKRILLLNSIIISYTGIPLFYSGDEIGQLNDWSYKNDESIAGDSRWLHRGKMDWEAAKKRYDPAAVQGQVFMGIKKMISIRRSSPYFRSDIASIPVDLGNPCVFGFHKENKMMVLANFSEREQWVDANRFSWFGLPGEMKDLLTGRPIRSYDNQILLGPYEYVWLV